jgi:streptogramin lyase
VLTDPRFDPRIVRVLTETGKLVPSTSGTITEFPVPQVTQAPIDIVAGPDGNLWFTGAVGKIGYITP